MGSRFPDESSDVPIETVTVNDTGRMGRDIFRDIVNGVKAQTDLKAISGSIEIEVNLSIEDKNVFKDDKIRNSKLVIKVNLEDS